jgi:hypothetical protein
MKTKAFQVIFMFFCTCFLYSCVITVGKEFTGDVKNIKIGITTRQDIENNFGFPFDAVIAHGLKSYMYVYLKIETFKDPKSKEIFLKFNENDTVNSYYFYSTFKEDKQIIFD